MLRDLNLRVAANEFLVLLGPSGAGKTTLLRTIAGLTEPNSGRILLEGSDITRWPPHRRELALVFQNGGWYDHLTVLQHLKFEGLSDADIRRTLDELELGDHQDRRPTVVEVDKHSDWRSVAGWLVRARYFCSMNR